jgi:AcrR family transcriptional regulator
VTTPTRSRAELIGDTAIEVLAAEGARGLTHRAVDRAAGLPPGSTSNHARTREALLTCALTRITQLEAADAAALLSSDPTDAAAPAPHTPAPSQHPDGPAQPQPQSSPQHPDASRRSQHPDPSVAALAAPIAGMLHEGLTRGRVRLLARYELALESTRRPALRAIYDEASRPFRDPASALLRAAGSTAPDRHARMLIAWCEGVQFDSLAGAGSASPPDLAELQAQVHDLIAGMLKH